MHRSADNSSGVDVRQRLDCDRDIVGAMRRRFGATQSSHNIFKKEMQIYIGYNGVVFSRLEQQSRYVHGVQP